MGDISFVGGPPRSNLRRGIPLISEDVELRGPGRVQLSAGLLSVDGGRHEGVAFRRPAYVPRGPWRAPTAEEYETLLLAGTAPPQPTAFVGLFRLSREFHAFIEGSGLWSIHRLEDARSFLRRVDFIDEMKGYLEDVLPFCVSPESFHVIGFNVGPPDLPTLGMDAGKRLGIHVDDWDMAPRRVDSRNRICINLGREPRMFMYINAALDQLGSDLGEDENGRGTRVGHRFMAANTAYPVVSVRVDPCEAYIAPTDNVFHDGTSKGKQYPDVTYNILGYFKHLRA